LKISPEEEVEKVEALLSNRPRKILQFETPLEAFRRMAGMPFQ
jgi:IS30 family transposase